jgi:hypothetical protein
MSIIITRNSATSGSIPASLVQGELAINVTDGKLFYGSGSGNDVKEFTGSASGGTINTGSFATTGSNTFNGSQVINGNLTVNGTASITFLNVTYESASVIYSSGSNQFGDASNDAQTLWGIVDIKTGPVLVTGSLNVSGGITGSLLGTASYATNALSASNALTASFITASGVYGPYGSNSVISASYALSASFAQTASYGINVTISGSISNVDYIDFNTGSAVPTWKSGRVYWDNTDGCLAVYNAEQDITLQVGQENWTRVSNRTGTTITNGTAVRIIGAHGDVPEIERAQSIAVSGSVNLLNQILGIATHDIEDNSIGYITTQGLVRGLNTNAFNDGDTLFVGTGSSGVLQNTAPRAPFEIIPIGVCVKASPGTSGIIYVAVQEPIDFSDLSSVLVSGSYHYGDLWTYVPSGSFGVWTHTNRLSGSYSVTGSWSATSFTGSLQGTSSWALNAITASYVTGSIFTNANSAASASFAQTASFVLNAVSSSFATSASFASTVPASGIIGLSLSQIATGSVTASVSPTQFTVTSASITEFTVTGTGVTIGNATTDTHRVTGSLNVSGSATIVGNTRITGSLNVNAESTNISFYNTAGTQFIGSIGRNSSAGLGIQADLADLRLSVGGFAGNIVLDSTSRAASLIRLVSTSGTVVSSSFTVFTGSAVEFQVTNTGVKIGNAITDTHTVTGSLNISGSVTATNFTGSLFGTSSWANNAISSSYALTASYALTSGGGGGGVSFVGGTNVDNRIITATGTTPELNGESNLTFDGSVLSVTGDVTANSFTGSLQGIASYAVTASYAETSQLTNNAYFAQGFLGGGDQVIPSAADEIIQFTDQYDPQGWWDDGTYKFTPTIAGYYTVSLGVWFENPNDNAVQLNVQMRVNGNQEMICQQPATTVSGVSLFGTKIVYLNGSTDYVDFTAYQGTAAAVKIQQGNSAGSGTWFSATYMTM